MNLCEIHLKGPIVVIKTTKTTVISLQILFLYFILLKEEMFLTYLGNKKNLNKLSLQ